ncbi:DUF2642 domain-containing protein [Bacillus sp. SJS]|uniref:DUF2642 domain-containing protein n=1 Tax=Bacillus sp. SJS TaxID=1423321 RepID=UPI0004DD8296|nr:DUF2642 domain-containing protein [Bacillus sp. SJS]KZZ86425.1 hypothetical protein AS29_000405 [Bacillus sp. SJS]
MKQKQNSRYWKSYVGETVKINRGGPEAKKGTLLDLGTDFLVLAVEKPGPKSPVVYYQLHHVKSVTAESNSEQEADERAVAAEEAERELAAEEAERRLAAAEAEARLEEAEAQKEDVKAQEIPDYYYSRNFRSLLRMHEGEEVQINQGGPDSVKGTILDVKSDFVIVKSKKDVLYISMYHIKSLAGIVSKEQENEQENEGKEDCGCEDEYFLAHSYDRLFQALRGSEIAIHSGGPEKAEGTLYEQGRGRYVLEGKKESIVIEPGHVRSIKAKMSNEEESNAEENQNGNEENENKSQDSNKNNQEANGKSEPVREHSYDRVYTQVTKTVDFHWKR